MNTQLHTEAIEITVKSDKDKEMDKERWTVAKDRPISDVSLQLFRNIIIYFAM